MIPPCPADAADEVPCSVENYLCGYLNVDEVCACYADPTDGLIWDCDSVPITW
jgi:hypothetical protein